MRDVERKTSEWGPDKNRERRHSVRDGEAERVALGAHERQDKCRVHAVLEAVPQAVNRVQSEQNIQPAREAERHRHGAHEQALQNYPYMCIGITVLE